LAIKLYTKSAEGGLSRAQYNLGIIYKSGWDVPKNMELSIKFFKMAADQNDAESAYKLAQIYTKQNDLNSAFKYYQISHSWEQGKKKKSTKFIPEN